MFIRNMMLDGNKLVYDETKNVNLLYKQELLSYINEKEKQTLDKGRKKSVSEIMKQPTKDQDSYLERLMKKSK